VDTVTLVVMGVSGAGKTTLAEALSARLGWPYTEGDDLHSAASIAKMRSGIPLTDDDRWPWLHRLAAWIGDEEAAGQSAVLTCSALRRAYRDVLRDGHPSVRFVHATVPAATLRARLEHRRGHFMPASLLDSQLATLEPLQPDEPGVTVDGEAGMAELVDRVLAHLGVLPDGPGALPDPAG
jgi:gluconokinase